MRDAKLLIAATAAHHLCQSLLAVREGPSDDLIREVSHALAVATASSAPADFVSACNREEWEQAVKAMRSQNPRAAGKALKAAYKEALQLAEYLHLKILEGASS
jgi:hypothetical protein